MEVKITQETKNLLLKRRELLFEVDHTQTKGTPSRIEIRNRLADLLKTKPELVYVKHFETKAGTMKAKGEANAYETFEQAKLIEPEYIIKRNMPEAEKKKPEEKAEKAAPAPAPAPAPTTAPSTKPAQPAQPEATKKET